MVEKMYVMYAYIIDIRFLVVEDLLTNSFFKKDIQNSGASWNTVAKLGKNHNSQNILVKAAINDLIMTKQFISSHESVKTPLDYIIDDGRLEVEEMK